MCTKRCNQSFSMEHSFREEKASKCQQKSVIRRRVRSLWRTIPKVLAYVVIYSCLVRASGAASAGEVRGINNKARKCLANKGKTRLLPLFREEIELWKTPESLPCSPLLFPKSVRKRLQITCYPNKPCCPFFATAVTTFRPWQKLPS